MKRSTGLVIAATLCWQAAGAAGIPLEIPLAEDGPTSLAIDDANGKLVRTVWYGEKQKAGDQTVEWDGTDDAGTPVSPGTYTWKALQSRTVQARYVSTVGNGRQPWQPGDHGGYKSLSPHDVEVGEDGAVYVCSKGHGKVIMKLSPEGKMIWAGPNTGTVEHPTAIALTDKYVYCANANEGWYRLSRKTGKVVPLSDGERLIRLPTTPKVTRETLYVWADPFADYQTRYIQDGIRRERDTRGLAVLGGRLYLPFYWDHQVRVYDAESGKELDRWVSVVHPAGIVATPGGELLLVSDRKVKTFSADGAFLGDVITENLSFPDSLALGADGKIYVTDLGIPNQVKVFSPAGRLLKTFGSAESLNGPVKSDKLYMPFGIAVDQHHGVYLAEWLIQRVQKLAANWQPAWSVQAFYAENCCEDVRNPSLIYGYTGFAPQAGALYEYGLDFTSGKWSTKRFWSFPAGNPCADVWGMASQGSAVRHIGSHRFYYLAHDTVYVFRLDGDRVVPVARLGNRQKFVDDQGRLHQSLPDHANGIWLDANGDGCPTRDEISQLDPARAKQVGLLCASSGSGVLGDGTVYFGNVAFELQGVRDGVPIYNWEHARVVDPFEKSDPGGLDIRSVGADPQGNRYYGLVGRGEGQPGLRYFAQLAVWTDLRSFDRDGHLRWRVGGKAAGFKRPGQWYFIAAVDWADGFVFAADEAGQVDVYTDDGLYVATLLRDGTRGGSPDNDLLSLTPHELAQVRAFRHPDTGAVYLIGQSHEGGEHLRVYEVTGLKQVRRLDGEIHLTPEQSRTFARRELKPAADPAKHDDTKKMAFVLRRTGELPVDGSAERWPRTSAQHLQAADGEIKADLLTFYDGEYYYVAVDCRGDTSPGVNANPDDVTQAWAGDCVEVYLGVKPDSDPNRVQYDSTDYQLLLPVTADGQPHAPIDATHKRLVEQGRVICRVHPDKQGWSLTARIPWAYFGEYRPVADNILGGDFTVNLGDAQGQKIALQLSWNGSGRSWVNPRQWGRLRMMYVD